jgi:hypothetical protein
MALNRKKLIVSVNAGNNSIEINNHTMETIDVLSEPMATMSISDSSYLSLSR